MAKKSKNSELLVHYARTMTPENLSRATNYVGNYILKGLGAFGKIMTAPLTGGPLGPATVILPKTKELLDAERKLRETQELLIGKASTWLSPLNYGAALMTGNGLNAKKGEEEVASWSPAWQAAARLGELYVGPKAVKGVKSTPRVIVNTAAKAGVKPAKAAVIAREIKLAIKNKPNIEVSKPIIRTRVGDVEIDNPQLFYRQGSAEMGDDFIKSGVVKTSGGFLNPMYTEGALFKKVPTRTKEGLSKGDKIALEGPYNKTKSDLLVTDSSVDMIPADQGSGKNYTWFEDYMLDPFAEESIFDKSRVPLFNSTATSANTTAYRWEPGYGYKKIVQEPSTSLKFFERRPSTIQISPEELYKVLKDQELNGYYFMGHGAGRTNVNPLVIFDNGLRIKNGDIGNTTSPISLSNLSLWPHANSKEIIILPGRAENVKFDSAHGRIPSDWYNNKTFQWDDNPGFEGSGFFAALKPNATFVETEINGVPGVYTKPEAILGSYNIDTQTLKLNPKSQYNFFKKQGGKMNILEFLKNGSGIHIKKKNRGKFTSYCGGNVTDECILRGKNSSNPAIRKRATFALNSRHWSKHKNGGLIIQLFKMRRLLSNLIK